MNEAQLILFIITSLVLIITPGQDMVLVLSRGVAQGPKAGIATAAGVSVGLIGHTMLAAFGLGALLMTSEAVFRLIKYAGAAYLIYLGFQLVFSKTKALEFKNGNNTPLSRLFLTGALSNISNPKITIFYFAYLPQFISSDILNPTYMLVMLGIGFSLLTFVVKGPVGYLAGRFSTWLRLRPKVLKWINRTSGTVLVGIGIKLAFERR
jgi:threonine/homoserine/homoserine lactone efflux protein